MGTIPAAPVPGAEHQSPSPSRYQFRFSWKWTLAIGTTVLLFLMWQCGSVLMSGKKLSDAAVQHFHQQLNAGQYEEIYNEADDGFRSGETHENIVKFLEAVHKKLGNSRDTDFVNIGVNATTNGTFTTTIYNATFDRRTFLRNVHMGQKQRKPQAVLL